LRRLTAGSRLAELRYRELFVLIVDRSGGR
jgi:hypothetical protein